MLSVAVGLGWRAATRSAGRRRTAWRSTLTLVAALGVIGTATAPTVVTRERGRLRELQATASSQRPRAAAVHQYRPNGERVVIVLVEPAGVASMPGLDGSLPTGSVRLSPALAAAVDSDPTLAAWFPGRRLVDLGPEAVGTAGELTAFLGVPPGGAAAALGAQQGSVSPNLPAQFGAYQFVGFFIFLAVPALALLVLSARLGDETRRRRFAALRLVGMPGWAIRAALGVELAVAAVAGVAIAVILALLPWPADFVIPVVGRRVFGVDARLPLWALVALAVLVVFVAAALGAATSGRRIAGRVRERVLRADPTRPWAVVVYGVGLALAVVAAVRAAPNDDRRFLATILVGVGMPGAVAVGASCAARVLGRVTGGVTWLIATRSLAAAPRRHTRVAGVVAVVVLGGVLGQPIAQVRSGGVTWVDDARAAGRTTIPAIIQMPTNTPLKVDLDRTPQGVHKVLPEVAVASADGTVTTTALVATCHDLEWLVGGQMEGCTGAPQVAYDRSTAPAPTLPHDFRLTAADGEVIPLTLGESPVLIGPADTPLPPIVVPPRSVPESTRSLPVVEAYLEVEATDAAWAGTQAWLVAENPVATLYGGEVGVASLDTTVGWIAAGLVASAGAAVLGAVASIADSRSERRRWWSLRVLGMARRTILGAAAFGAGIAATAGALAAVLPAYLLARSWLVAGGDKVDDPTVYVAVPLAGGLFVLAVGVVTAWIESRETSSSPPRST